MSAPVIIAKHPLHPMLIVFPIGLWVFSLISDFIFLLGGNVQQSETKAKAKKGARSETSIGAQNRSR